MDKIITKKEVKQKLVNQLESILITDNFKLNKSTGFINRKSQGKLESVFFRVLNYWPLCQEIEYVGFSIRFDTVEKIVNTFLSKYNFFNIECTKNTSTIGNSIFFNARIDNIENVDNFIHLHMNDIKQKVFDYFTKYNTIKDANQYKKNQILNDTSSLKGLNYHVDNFMQSLTLMKLCNDPDFEDLSQKYKELYTSWGGCEEVGIKAINDLIEYLSRK
ncbi:MAG: hypothetical protein LBK94_07930 [Prevotellaceae bacterium]|jgi:hypothetical protein|nr:hypothetical protein [Prevotellaceae bacterium]